MYQYLGGDSDYETEHRPLRLDPDGYIEHGTPRGWRDLACFLGHGQCTSDCAAYYLVNDIVHCRALPLVPNGFEFQELGELVEERNDE